MVSPVRRSMESPMRSSTMAVPWSRQNQRSGSIAMHPPLGQHLAEEVRLRVADVAEGRGIDGPLLPVEDGGDPSVEAEAVDGELFRGEERILALEPEPVDDAGAGVAF